MGALDITGYFMYIHVHVYNVLGEGLASCFTSVCCRGIWNMNAMSCCWVYGYGLEGPSPVIHVHVHVCTVGASASHTFAYEH